MRKINWILSGVLSLVISIISNIESKNVTFLISNTLFTFLGFYGLIISISLLIMFIRNKTFKKIFFLVPLFIISIFWIYLLVIYPRFGLLLTCQMDHSSSFRTNIFTGKCELNPGGTGCSDPSMRWYLKDGCKIPLSQEEKIELAKNMIAKYEYRYRCQYLCDTATKKCQDSCGKDDPVTYFFCERKIIENISCKEILSCPAVVCE